MSMIMRVARGTVPELERLAAAGGDETLPPAFVNLLSQRAAAFNNLPPEIIAQVVSSIETNPQLSRLGPQLIERLRSELTVVPPTREADGNGGADRQRPGAAARRPETLDLHKSWHVFHYLFTGRAAEGGTPPANLLMEGGREVGADQGYGPSRLIDPAETAAFARFVGSLTSAELVRRIDAPRMAELGIYCAGDGNNADAAEMQDDVELYFPRLQAHFRAAAESGQSTLVWLT